jgi:ABC-type multidrug transport system ATPase subunit
MKHEQKKTVIRLDDVFLEFALNLAPNFVVFNVIHFEVYESERVGIFGPSGIGKTSLLKMISGILKPTHGNIYIRDEVGFLSEDYYLNPFLTIFEFLEYLKLINTYNKSVEELLEIYNLTEVQNNLINSLSKGQLQILRLVSLLMKKPKIILADEPFSNLDIDSITKINAIFQDIVQKDNITIIMTTHNLDHLKEFDTFYEISDSKLNKIPAHKLNLSVND